MEKLKNLAKFISILAFVAFLISFGLAQYKNSFDPYLWMYPTDLVISRRWYLEKRFIYMFIAFISLISFFISIFVHFTTRKGKINLK